MTELIDLSTLATLGQHFSSAEDVAELKGAVTKIQNEVTKVQNDVALIKSFLLQQFGNAFSSVLNGSEDYYEKVKPVTKKVSKPLEQVTVKMEASDPQQSVVNGLLSVRKLIPLNSTNNAQHQQPQRSKPPPLQRFSRVNSSGEGANLLMGNNNVISNTTTIIKASAPPPASTVKPEKFHRNFLSSRFSSSSSGTSSSNRLLRSSTGSNGSSSLSGTAIIINAMNGGKTKMEPQKRFSSGGGGNVNAIKRMRTSAIPLAEETYVNGMDNEEFNVSEDAYAAVAVTDGNYDETGEADDEELGYAAAYDDTGDFQEGDFGDDHDPMAQMVYQEEEEDGTVYEDYFPGQGLDTNEMVANQSSTSSSRVVNGGRAITNRKAQQRRLSLPATTTSNEMDELNNVSDPNFLKKCKICHEEFLAYSLFNHVIDFHYSGEVPTCSICKKTFTYKQGLISHMRYHDAGKYDKECSFCGKKFIRKSDVVIHERRLHTGERPFQCPVDDCNLGFVRRYCLLTHIKTNHGEAFMSLVEKKNPSGLS